MLARHQTKVLMFARHQTKDEKVSDEKVSVPRTKAADMSRLTYLYSMYYFQSFKRKKFDVSSEENFDINFAADPDNPRPELVGRSGISPATLLWEME